MAELDPRVKNICKIGQGHDRCRYLVMATKGFECGKINPAMRKVLDDDAQRASFASQGDNCEGKELRP
jgi:hypothetical protein